MLSTPAPIPQCIIPLLILLAIIETASRPEEQNLLTEVIGTSIGISAKSYAVLKAVVPAPGINTLPTTISSINFGSMEVSFTTAFSTWASISSGLVLLRPPFLAFVKGVLKQDTITTSLSSFLFGKLNVFILFSYLLILEILSIFINDIFLNKFL